MSNRIDIYNLAGNIRHYEKRLKDDSAICEASKADVLAFVNACYSEGLSNARVSIYLIRLYHLAKKLNKPFREATKEDLQGLMAEIERSDHKPGYKQLFKVSLKRFYKWLEGNGETYPDKVKWIKTAAKGCSSKLPEELLTQEDVRKLIDAAYNPRDKAWLKRWTAANQPPHASWRRSRP